MGARLVQGADIFIATHGQALSWLPLLPKGAALLTLVVSDAALNFHRCIAAWDGEVHYYALWATRRPLGTGCVPDYGDAARNFSLHVPLPDFRNLLRAIRWKHFALPARSSAEARAWAELVDAHAGAPRESPDHGEL